jgi:Fe-S cluster assembly ATP-binding protein
MLELKNISWSLPNGGREVIKDISLSIPQGKLVVVTGPNGGGKTTLAKIIAGIATPDSGKILLEGEDITLLDITERAKRGISFAFQQPVRFKGITVRDLLALAAGRELNQAELCDLLGKVGLCTRDYIDREVNASLSGGEIKRIEIASVLARGTKYSVFDEPEAGIDLWSFTGLIKVFEDLKNINSGTQIIISHQERILNIADEIVVIADGKIREYGAKEDILPKLLAGDKNAGCPVERRIAK